MNKNITRGLALVAITGGFSFLGITAANAVDLPNGDTDSILDSLRVPADVDVPVTVDGLAVSVLPSNDASSVLGNGIFASTGDTMANLFAQLGIDTSDVIDTETLTSTVGIPIDASNTWLSILGNEPNGIVVVPNASAPAAASVTDGADGFIDAFIDAPISISCTSVAVLSDYSSGCAETTAVGTDGILDGLFGDLLGDVVTDNTSNTVPVDVRDKQIDVLDGGTLGGDGVLGDEGILIDPTDDTTDLRAAVDPIDAQTADVAAPVDASDAWVSVFGHNGGVVVVPDSTIDGALLTAGLFDSETFAPIALECLTITVLSDYERACAAEPTDPTDPTTPVEPTDPATPIDGDNDGAADGGNGGTDEGDVCAAGTTLTATTDTDSGVDAGLLGGAVLAGGLAAFGLMALGRKLNVL